MKKFVNSDIFIISIASIILFALIFPLSRLINFYQNDDWVYYRVIEWFLKGQFEVHNYIEATFYTQAFIGMVFAKIFGIQKLPILSLLISVLNFTVFTYTVKRFYIDKMSTSLLLGLLFFLNPLHSYGIFGFMTDNYFLFFMLITFLLTEFYLKTEKPEFFVGLNIFMFVGFFSRQLSIISGITLAIWLIYSKRYKMAVIQSLVTISLLIYYFVFYSKTNQQVVNQDLVLLNLFNLQRSFSAVFISLIYVSIFFLPISLILINKYFSGSSNRLRDLIKLGGLTLVILLFAIFTIQAPVKHRNNMFYYTNTVEQNGFFYGSTLGDKYKIYNQEQIYFYLDLFAKISASITIASILLIRKRVINYYFIFAILYLGIICLMNIVYDRYLLILLPISLLFILNIASEVNKLTKIVLGLYLVFLIYFVYNFALDFVILNKVMWDISNKLVSEKNVPKNQISAGYGWRRANRNYQNHYKYVFYFEPKENNKDLNCCFSLVQTQKIEYPFSFFENPKIYLYKRKF